MKKRLDWFIGGAFGFWMLCAFAFFIYAAFTSNYNHAAFRIAGGFFCLVLASIAEARRTIIKVIKNKEETNGKRND